MKKLLSMLIVGLFTGLSFASATDINITASDNDFGYSPYSLSITNSAIINSVSYDKANNSDNTFVVCSSNDNDGKCGYETAICQVDSYGDGINTCSNVSLTAGTYYFYNSGNDPIDTLVLSYTESNGGSEGGSIIGNTNAVSQGVISGVNSFTAGLGNVVPVLILLGLPIFIVVLFRRKVWSYLKHFFSPR